MRITHVADAPGSRRDVGEVGVGEDRPCGGTSAAPPGTARAGRRVPRRSPAKNGGVGWPTWQPDRLGRRPGRRVGRCDALGSRPSDDRQHARYADDERQVASARRRAARGRAHVVRTRSCRQVRQASDAPRRWCCRRSTRGGRRSRRAACTCAGPRAVVAAEAVSSPGRDRGRVGRAAIRASMPPWRPREREVRAAGTAVDHGFDRAGARRPARRRRAATRLTRPARVRATGSRPSSAAASTPGRLAPHHGRSDPLPRHEAACRAYLAAPVLVPGGSGLTREVSGRPQPALPSPPDRSTRGGSTMSTT